ncbi:hypothetical protein GCM10010388_35370 [Streptomyces mauvecolor]
MKRAKPRIIIDSAGQKAVDWNGWNEDLKESRPQVPVLGAGGCDPTGEPSDFVEYVSANAWGRPFWLADIHEEWRR